MRYTEHSNNQYFALNIQNNQYFVGYFVAFGYTLNCTHHVYTWNSTQLIQYPVSTFSSGWHDVCYINNRHKTCFVWSYLQSRNWKTDARRNCYFPQARSIYIYTYEKVNNKLESMVHKVGVDRQGGGVDVTYVMESKNKNKTNIIEDEGSRTARTLCIALPWGGHRRGGLSWVHWWRPQSVPRPYPHCARDCEANHSHQGYRLQTTKKSKGEKRNIEMNWLVLETLIINAKIKLHSTNIPQP